jgi:hypothetical protein
MSSAIASPSELNLTELYDVVEALRRGEFDRRIAADGLTGRAGMVARALNSTMQMLENFKAEQLRIADEIGRQGTLGCTMEVFGAVGGWLEMMDAMNRLSTSLTIELRRTSNTAAKLARGESVDPPEPGLIGGEVAALQRHLCEVRQSPK